MRSEIDLEIGCAKILSDEPDVLFPRGQRRLRRALADIPAEVVVRLEVPLLSEDAVARLAATAGIDCAALFHATEGNAFFTSELIASGAANVLPSSVADAVLGRAEKVSPSGRHALEATAVFPREAELATLLTVLGLKGAQAVGECVDAGILFATSDNVRFRHELARRAIEDALSAADRRAINERVLQAPRLEPTTPATRVFHHARQAQDFAVVQNLAPATAAEASAVGSHREAADLLTAALDSPGGDRLEERADLLVKLAIELYLIGRTRDALTRLDEARRRLAQSGEALREGDCLRWISRLNYLDGNRVAAEEQAGAAIERLATLPPGPEFAMALSNGSQLAMLADRIEDTLQFGRAAVDLAERLGRQDIVCHALNNMGAVEVWRDVESARGEKPPCTFGSRPPGGSAPLTHWRRSAGAGTASKADYHPRILRFTRISWRVLPRRRTTKDCSAGPQEWPVLIVPKPSVSIIV